MIVLDENGIIEDGATVVALGNFDGLHVAHMAIIRSGIEYAKEHGLKSGVLLFEENFKNVDLITPKESKVELLDRENLDFVKFRSFTKEFMQLSPEEFIKQLVENLRIRAVCVGYDYRFGYKAEGDIETLRSLGKKYGFCVLVTDVIKIGGKIVSSTYIRELIKSGDVETAERFLGRRFCVQGSVEKGLQNGRKMGIPTANVGYSPDMAIPKNGVYAGITYVNGKRFKCVINVGKNPTFNADKTTIESHILDFSEDIYGEYIRVSFAKRLRDDIKFESVKALQEQIRSDINRTLTMDL